MSEPNSRSILIVEDDYFVLKGFRFGKNGEFLEENEYRTLKDIDNKKLLFRMINGLTYCAICLTIQIDIRQISLEDALLIVKNKDTKNGNHFVHLTTTKHNPQQWSFRSVRHTNTNQTTIAPSSSQAMMLETVFEGSMVKQLRWALVLDLANGKISKLLELVQTQQKVFLMRWLFIYFKW